MRAVDLIAKKRDGGAHSAAELQFLINGFLQGSIPDYQMSAWLMAVYLQGMNVSETVALTRVMFESGDQVDLSQFLAPTVDKHSTGGVGDKISLVLGPLLAAAGLIVGKLTGRGLGHTGGTVDKLESIPGFSTELTEQAYLATLEKIGISMISAGPSLAPADQLLYALRDVTATVGCLPLVASSIMSKKLAGGAEHILLDVKYGRGAFMSELADASELARLMISIGHSFGRKTRAVISEMGQPLGLAVGNSLEVQEAIAVLKGEGPTDVTELTLNLASELLQSAEGLPAEQALARATKLLATGAAFEKFREFVAMQGGDSDFVLHPERLPTAPLEQLLVAPQSGYVTNLDALVIGQAAMLTGAGRAAKGDAIDYSAGILLKKKRGSWVAAGETLAVISSSDAAKLAMATAVAESAWQFGVTAPRETPLIAARWQ